MSAKIIINVWVNWILLLMSAHHVGAVQHCTYKYEHIHMCYHLRRRCAFSVPVLV